MSLIRIDHSRILDKAREQASLSRMQFFTALEDMGLYDTVWAMQDDETVPKKIRIMLRTASSFDRLHPEMIAMATSIGFGDAELDTLFGIGVAE